LKFIQTIMTWINVKKLGNKEQTHHVSSLIIQFVIFLIISVPIGIWWSVYAYARFGMPIGYVPKLPNNIDQYIGHYSTLARFFDFNLVQVKSVFENWGSPSFEHNILIAILKTSLFGEYDFRKTVSFIALPATILFWTNVILTVLSVFAMVYVCIKKLKNNNYVMKTFFSVMYIVIVGSFIKFCFQFPHTCTMDFRYIVPTLIFGAIAIGLFVNELEKKKTIQNKIISYAICTLTIVFAAFSVLIYSILWL